MLPLPDQHQLIGFFEAEPILSFPNESWEYNELTFVFNDGPRRLLCQMEPAEMIFRINWYDGDTELLSLNIESAEALKIDDYPAKPERMRVTFSDGRGQTHFAAKTDDSCFHRNQVVMTSCRALLTPVVSCSHSPSI